MLGSQGYHNLSKLKFIFYLKVKLNDHLRMHGIGEAEREYSCNICGEEFRNIFPLQAHQRDVQQVGAGKRKRKDTTSTRAKR